MYSQKALFLAYHSLRRIVSVFYRKDGTFDCCGMFYAVINGCDVVSYDDQNEFPQTFCEKPCPLNAQ